MDVQRFAGAEPVDLGVGTKLLFVGRLDERKGFPTAVRTFARLAAERPDLRLVVAGEGPDRDALARLGPEFGDRVIMLGSVPNVDLPPFHAACDAYLGPAVGGESFGVVLVEAMSAGLPVIASDIPGYREVVRNGLDGLLVPPRDPAAMAAAVERVLSDENLADRLRNAGLERARGIRLVGRGVASRGDLRARGRRAVAVDTIVAMSPVLWVVVGVVVVVAVGGVYLYNRLVAIRTRVDNGWSQIDVQLRRRYDLIPNLVETVKGYARHEREVFERVTQARAGAMAADGVQPQAQAENAVTGGLRQLFAVAENYPDLKANQNFLALQEELTGTESKIAYARQFYNDQVMRLNTLVGSVPSNIIARMFGFEAREFFDIDDPEREPVQVDLSPDA